MRWHTSKCDDTVKKYMLVWNEKLFFFFLHKIFTHLLIYILYIFKNSEYPPWNYFLYKSNIEFIHMFWCMILLFSASHVQYCLFLQYYYFFECTEKSKKFSPEDKSCILIILDLFNFSMFCFIFFFFLFFSIVTNWY